MNKRLLTVLVTGTVLTLAALSPVHAEDYTQQIEASNSKISTLATQQDTVYSDLAQVSTELANVQTRMAEVVNQRFHTVKEAGELQQEIAKLEKLIAERQERLNEQVRAVQVNGTASYVDFLLESESLTDAFQRMGIIIQMLSANSSLIEEQARDKEALETKEAQKQEKIAEQEQQEADFAALKAELDEKAASYTQVLASLSEEQLAEIAKRDNLVIKKEELERQVAEAKAAAEKAEAEKAASVVHEEYVEESTSVVRSVEIASGEAKSGANVAALSLVNSISGNTYPVGECTWGAKQVAPWAGNYWGNGGDWAYSASAAGFRTGSTPTVGAIASWNNGGYGHVAVVTAVDSNGNIQVLESNVQGHRTVGNYRGWFSPTTAQGTVTYIYPN